MREARAIWITDIYIFKHDATAAKSHLITIAQKKWIIQSDAHREILSMNEISRVCFSVGVKDWREENAYPVFYLE